MQVLSPSDRRWPSRRPLSDRGLPGLSRGVWARPVLSTLLALTAGGLAVGAVLTQAAGPAGTLVADQVLERSLRGGQGHAFVVPLSDGDYLDASLAPHGVTADFRLRNAEGDVLFEEQLPGGTGPKSIEWVAESSGGYRLEVLSTSLGNRRGRYRLEVRALRPACAADRTRFAARRALDEGESLLWQGQDAALEPLERAASLALEAGDRALEGKALGWIGLVHRRRGDLTAAGDALSGAFERRCDLGPYPRADALLGLAGLARQEKDFQRALHLTLEALPLLRQAGARVSEATAFQSLAAVYSDVGNFNHAVSALTSAGQIMKEEGLVDQQARVLSSLGRVHWLLEDGAKALAHHRAAEGLWRRLGDDGRLAETWADIGLAYRLVAERRGRVEDYALSTRHLERALEAHARLGNESGQRLALQGLRRNCESRGDWERALQHSLRVLELPGGADWPEFLARARIELERGRLREAREWVERALATAESRPPRIQSYDLRASYEGSLNHLYDLHVHVLMKLHQADPGARLDWAAFEASEKGRARALRDSLGGSPAPEGARSDASLLRREGELSRAVETLRSRLARDGTNARRETDLQSALVELEEVRGRLRRGSHREAMSPQRPPRLREIQALLDEESLLLEYDTGRQASYLWAITRSSFESHELPAEDVLEPLVRRLPESIARRVDPPLEGGAGAILAERARADAGFAKDAARLAEQILGPVRPGPRAKRLLFVWDGALHYVPVAALPPPRGWHSTPGAAPAGSSLIARFEIATLPSVSVAVALERLRQRRDPPRKRLAVFADPVFGPSDERLGPTAQPLPAAPPATERELLRLGTMSGSELTRLPHTARLAEEILHDVPPGEGLAALGLRATREAALDPALADYRTIVFATHGLLDTEFPSLSGIVLSTVDAQGRPRNGILRQHDVYGLELNADLVVLAGCETGVGKQIRGEGLLGLSRGFLYAGASRVVASLWKVEEGATAELVARFLRRVEGGGQGYAAALREAQSSLARDPRWAAPYFWAGFVLQGDWR